MSETPPPPRELTRAALEADYLRQGLENSPLRDALLTDEQLDRSLHDVLAAAPTPGDVWLFAYGSLHALGFAVLHGGPSYAGRLTDEAVVECLCRTTGKLGRGIDYLRSTIDGLAQAGITDRHLLRLDALARGRGAGSVGGRGQRLSDKLRHCRAASDYVSRESLIHATSRPSCARACCRAPGLAPPHPDEFVDGSCHTT